MRKVEKKKEKCGDRQTVNFWSTDPQIWQITARIWFHQ